jgi:uncharacterized protein (TIGR03000 family)
MLRQMFTKIGVPAAVAALLLMSGPAWAQHGGGGHGGGGHGGGFHGGGGFQHGGFHHDGFRRGFYPGYYYDYYPSYGFYPSYSYYPNDLGYGSAPDQGYDPSYGAVTSPTVSPDTASVQPESTAQITVSVPANAELWFDSSMTTSRGPVREFQSPPLTPGQYTYDLRALDGKRSRRHTDPEGRRRQPPSLARPLPGRSLISSFGTRGTSHANRSSIVTGSSRTRTPVAW